MVFVSFKPSKSNPNEYYGNVDNISDRPYKRVPDYIILLDLKAILVALVHFSEHHHRYSYPSEEKGHEKADD